MATAISQQTALTRPAVSVSRLLVTGALTAVIAFVLCWLGTLVPFSSPTHAYISLFTTAPVQSAAALVEGGLWSVLFGGLVGGLFAIIYNACAVLDR